MIFWNQLWFYTANWDETAPAGSQSIGLGDDAIRNFKRDVRERLASEHTDITGTAGSATMTHNAGRCSVAYYGTTAEVAALSTPPQYSVAFDTTLKSWKYYTGAVWTRGDSIPSGTKMLFYTDTAPAGWSLDATLDDKLVYVTKSSGSGGQTGGAAHTTGTWTTTHTHTLNAHVHSGAAHTHGAGTYSVTLTTMSVSSASPNYGNDPAQGGAYSVTGTSASGGAGDTGANSDNTSSASIGVSWRPSAYCFIVCSKD